MTRLGGILALLGAFVAGCTAVVTPTPHSAPSAPAIGIVTLQFPVVSGSRGTIAGYFPEQLAATDDPISGSRDPQFTYVIDFQVVEVVRAARLRGHDEPILPARAEGVRRIYFHPDGARITFADLSRFVAGDPIATDRVTFTFHFAPDYGQVVLRMSAYRTSTRAIDYDGHAVRPPGGRESSFTLFGRFSSVYGGYLLTGPGV
jgi:hypothetical protein